MLILSSSSSFIITIIVISIIYFYTSCTTNNCDIFTTLSTWELSDENNENAILTRKCTNKYSNIDGCSKLDPNILKKVVNWNNIKCNKACGIDSNGYKSLMIDNIKITSKNTYPCNTELCNTLVDYGVWTKVSETSDNVTINRTCTNKDSERDACSLIPDSELNKTINWTGTNTCSLPCNSGINNKTAVIDNTTITSTNTYPCNTETCLSLVNFSNWIKVSETSDNITIKRTCTNKNSNRDACSLIPNSELNKTINWTGTNTCSSPCNSGINNKIITIDNTTLTSTNTYPCNTETCSSLVNYGNWTKVSEGIDNVTINRTCTNKDSNRNACSLIPNTDLNKTINWTGTNTCSSPCNTGYNNKNVMIDNTIITSTNTYPCNTETCNTLVNFGNWTKVSEDNNNVAITRTCTNKDQTRNACSLLSSLDLNKTISWNGFNTCTKPCNTGTNNKIVTVDNTTITSANTNTCNTETCLSLVNFGNWTKVSENSDNITITRTCTNKNPTRDACSLIPSTDLNKTISWSGTNSCSVPCNSGTNNKIVTYENTNFTSTNTFPCNTETCSSLVYYLWEVNSNDNNIINKKCYNINSNRNACSLLTDSNESKTITFIYPPAAIPNNTQSITSNNITYKISNQGGNGTFSAWTFDNDFNTWTWYDGAVTGKTNIPGQTGYNTTTGEYLGQADATNNITGSWHQMEVSSPININGYYFSVGSPFRTWYLFASNDGTTWTQLDYQNFNFNLPINKRIYFIFDNNTSYKFYRFVINKSLNTPNIQELKFLKLT